MHMQCISGDQIESMSEQDLENVIDTVHYLTSLFY